MPKILFKPGNCMNPKGRPKGTTNRIKYDVGAILEAHKFNPVEELIHLAKTTDKESIKMNCCTELISYVAAKLKSLEITSDQEKESFQMYMSFGKNTEESK